MLITAGNDGVIETLSSPHTEKYKKDISKAGQNRRVVRIYRSTLSLPSSSLYPIWTIFDFSQISVKIDGFFHFHWPYTLLDVCFHRCICVGDSCLLLASDCRFSSADC